MAVVVRRVKKGFGRRGVAVAAGLALVAAYGFSATIAAKASASVPASPATVTFTSSRVGTSGETSTFTESGQWQMSWSYNCFGSSGNFGISINAPSSDSSFDVGPNELGDGGSGTDYYFDASTFSLSINSECAWTISVSPNPTPPGGPSATFTSSRTGSAGNTAEFTETGDWQMVWTYNCSAYGSSGNFIVFINAPANDSSLDTGPNELGPAGGGTDHYADVGTFSLTVDSECAWAITVNGPAPVPRCNRVLPDGSVVGMAVTGDGKGYWIASSTGAVAACGDAPVLGDGLAGTAAIATAPGGDGYWLVTGSGAVEAFGTAVNHGGVPFTVVLAKPIVAMAADPATGGYWLLGGDGGVFSYDAPFYGSTGNIRLVEPAVGLEATLNGGGYRFVASDGGIFDFGNAPFYGSLGGIKLNKPVVGMADDPATGGYWLDASDGGIFSFRAPFYGSTGGIALAKPCVGMTAMPAGNGYRFVASDGGIFDFGSAPFYGSAAE
jgi:hypothetical protein